MVTTPEQIPGLESHRTRIEQLTRYGDITIWGKPKRDVIFTEFLFDKIDPDFWVKNPKISWAPLVIEDSAYTTPRGSLDDTQQFEELMVNKAQFERGWQDG